MPETFTPKNRSIQTSLLSLSLLPHYSQKFKLTVTKHTLHSPLHSITMTHILIITLTILIATTAAAGEDSGAVVEQQQLWCVAKNNAEDTALQQALDWACGPGAADCGPIQQGGPCYDTSDLIGMATYAFNDYCIKHGMSDETCSFGNTAALIALDPSHGKCKYPSSSYSAANSSTPSTAGILPGSENLSGSGRLCAMWVWRSAAVNLLLAIFTVLQ